MQHAGNTAGKTGGWTKLVKRVNSSILSTKHMLLYCSLFCLVDIFVTCDPLKG
jgi:hypothetical protein